MKSSSDGGDDDGAHAGDGAHVSGLEKPGVHMRLENKISPYLRLIRASRARQLHAPWSEVSCCEYDALQGRSRKDGTMMQVVGHGTCKISPLCLCLSLLPLVCFPLEGQRGLWETLERCSSP